MTPEEIAALLQQPSKQQALLNALRGQKSLGFVGQASGDRVLSGLGAGLVQDAGAQEAADFRQRQFTLEKALAAARAREAQQAALAEEERRRQQHLADQQFQADQNDLGRKNALRAAAIGSGMVEQRSIRAEERAAQRKAEEDAAKALAGKQKSVQDVEERSRNVMKSLDDLERQVRESGTFDLTGPANSNMDALITNYAIDMAKMKDPTSVAREGEVETEKKALFSPGTIKAATTSNETALELIRKARERAQARRDEAYRVRGLDIPGAAGPSGGGRPVKMKFPNGKVYPVDASEIDAARRRGGVEVPE